VPRKSLLPKIPGERTGDLFKVIEPFVVQTKDRSQKAGNIDEPPNGFLNHFPFGSSIGLQFVASTD
jgi:hypothetical protein